MVKELVCGHGDESSIPFNDIINLVLNDYNMITYVVNDYNMTTCVLNNYKMTTYFYLKCKFMWRLRIVVLDMTRHHVMLGCLSKLSNMILMTIVIYLNMIIIQIVNIIIFFF
jgi:hypothetical protein